MSESGGYLGDVYFEGWDYRRQPPRDVVDERFLAATDPWLALCCVIERAKQGDLSGADHLPALCRSPDSDLRLAAQYLLASIGSVAQLDVLAEHIVAADASWRMETADHAALSGSLQFVDPFIAGYRVAFGETTRAAMVDGLSNLLSTDPEDRFVIDCLMATDRDTGERRLRAAAEQKARELGARVCLYNGAPFSIGALADEIDETLREGEPFESFAHLQSLITRLQTILGFSQAGMFEHDDDGTERWDHASIRRQLDAARLREHTPGLRYFFGHPAPL